MSVRFNGQGVLESITDVQSGEVTTVKNDIVFYQGMAGNCSKGEFQPSGAYIFRSNGTSPKPWGQPAKVMSILVTTLITMWPLWCLYMTMCLYSCFFAFYTLRSVLIPLCIIVKW